MTTTAPRRELLLEAAAELFAARGYHAVGIDDIGSAAGITGPGVYRHFASKQALLEALCDRTLERMLDRAHAAQGLKELVAVHVRFAVEDRALLACWVRERRALDEATRRVLRNRLRKYEQVWREALIPHRPELAPEEVALTVGAVIAMLNSTALIDSPLEDQARAALLTQLAVSALFGA